MATQMEAWTDERIPGGPEDEDVVGRLDRTGAVVGGAKTTQTINDGEVHMGARWGAGGPDDSQ